MPATRIQVQVVVTVAAIVFAAGIVVTGGDVDPGWLRFFGAAVVVSLLLLGTWDRFLWRLPFVQRLQSVPPDLRGTWKGEFQSLVIDPSTGETVPTLVGYWVIRQTASTAKVTFTSAQSQGEASLAQIGISPAGRTELNYMYFNSPSLQAGDVSRPHRGAVALIDSGRPAERLGERYWTDRQTGGGMTLLQRRPEYADDFDTAARLFDPT